MYPNLQLERAKKDLIENLMKKGIKNKKVLASINKINREDFIDISLIERAYDDNALPISDGQTISQPYTICFMLELLELMDGLKILEIGTGSGYLTAILVDLGLEVFSVERSEILYNTSKDRLKGMNIPCKLKFGDGTEGWIEYAPFDRVVISAASPIFPEYLSAQLNEGAIIVCPVGDKNSQTMNKGIYRNNKFDINKYDSFRFVPLVGKKGWDAE